MRPLLEVIEAWRHEVERARPEVDGLRVELTPPGAEDLRIATRVQWDHASLGRDDNVTMGVYADTVAMEYRKVCWRRLVRCRRHELRPLVRALDALGFQWRLHLPEGPTWGLEMLLFSASTGTPLRNPPLAHLRRWYGLYRMFEHGWDDGRIRRALRRLRRNELARMFRRWAGLPEHPWERWTVEAGVDSNACYHAGTVYMQHRRPFTEGADVVTMAAVAPEPELWQCEGCYHHTLVWPGAVDPRCELCSWPLEEDRARG